MPVENKEDKAGFVAMEAVEAISGKDLKGFLDRHVDVKEGQDVRTDALRAMNIIDQTHNHDKKVTRPGEASRWYCDRQFEKVS